MIVLPADYSRVRAYDGTGGSAKLPVGGYVCRILDAASDKLPSGGDRLSVIFEIVEGPYAGYFKEKYEHKKQYGEAKWPGVFRAPVLTREGKTSGYFKGLLTSIEQSNDGYKFTGDEKTLKNKLVGFNFGERDFQASDGQVRTVVEPFYAVSVKRVRDGIEPPPKKELRGAPAAQNNGFVEVPDDQLPDLPF